MLYIWIDDWNIAINLFFLQKKLKKQTCQLKQKALDYTLLSKTPPSKQTNKPEEAVSQIKL